ncbi:metallophosphoesterase [Candidatus Woesearchaeota archaeon]|nr:metallophosphoesterase [Candidatus Woesearchaeota archaeon]
MKICAIGDPHGDLKAFKKIPLSTVDLILIVGDIGKADFIRKRYFENIKRKEKGLPKLELSAADCKKMYSEIYDSTIDICKHAASFAPTYSILGNVGTHMIQNANVRKDEEKYDVKLPYLRTGLNKIKDFSLVRNRMRKIEGVKVGFLEYFEDVCWYKEFSNTDKKRISKAKKETAKAKQVLENFNELDILVCHQTPFGFLDKVNNPSAPKNWRGKRAGSKVILNYIKKECPKYVFCGHMHEHEGMKKISKTEVYNLGVCGYKLIEF